MVPLVNREHLEVLPEECCRGMPIIEGAEESVKDHQRGTGTIGAIVQLERFQRHSPRAHFSTARHTLKTFPEHTFSICSRVYPIFRSSAMRFG